MIRIENKETGAHIIMDDQGALLTKEGKVLSSEEQIKEAFEGLSEKESDTE